MLNDNIFFKRNFKKCPHCGIDLHFMKNYSTDATVLLEDVLGKLSKHECYGYKIEKWGYDVFREERESLVDRLKDKSIIKVKPMEQFADISECGIFIIEKIEFNTTICEFSFPILTKNKYIDNFSSPVWTKITLLEDDKDSNKIYSYEMIGSITNEKLYKTFRKYDVIKVYFDYKEITPLIRFWEITKITQKIDILKEYKIY